MSSKGFLPGPSGPDMTAPGSIHASRSRRTTSRFRVLAGILMILTSAAYLSLQLANYSSRSGQTVNVPVNAEQLLDKCRTLNTKPSVPVDFYERKQSDRFEAGTKPTFITNATIWTGRLNGLEQFKGDVLLDGGIIREVGNITRSSWIHLQDLVTIDANGAWLSSGIVDTHSHLGVDSLPDLGGTRDTNSRKGIVQPWLRALDGLNTHDEAYRLSVSGGVTTALVLPGSANAIGGQGILIKLRPTSARSPTAMLLENPYSTNTTEYDPSLGLRWRQMKHACGENPARVYSGTRMDTTWAFRQAYDKARQIKTAQDAFCVNAQAGKWDVTGEFPEDYQWEALVDVLRGRVKVHNHCYETVDLDDMVRITNEFKFSIAAFHHAHETYLVPSTLKKAYGHPPAVALFSIKSRFKRESYRGSEFAPKILAENGLQVIMKSDHPVLDSRYLLNEAQTAHYFGLPSNLALAAVTSTPAEVIGQDHRIGFIKPGYDADVVLWDSHPLALGATPKQVWIDGIPQIKNPHVVEKPASSQVVPETPNFDEEAQEALDYEGVPPLAPKHSVLGSVVFLNVSSVYLRIGNKVERVLADGTLMNHEPVVVHVDNGNIICIGARATCLTEAPLEGAFIVDLQGGSLSPGLVTYGTNIGLEEIQAQSSTRDGVVFDPLIDKIPSVVGGDGAIIRASDGLSFFTRHALIAYRSGITASIVAPQHRGLLAGLSVAFSTGTEHKLKSGALIQEDAAVHVEITHSSSLPSISTQIAALRNLLLGNGEGEVKEWFHKVTKGKIPLVVSVESADIIAHVIQLKREIEEESRKELRLTLSGATEAHLLAKEISEANIGVVIRRTRSFPEEWEYRRILPGPPLSAETPVSILLAHNVTVGIGEWDPSLARNLRFDIGWAALAATNISPEEALALGSVNVEKLLGVDSGNYGDLVATRGGGLLDLGGKVVAVISPRRGLVDVL